MISGALRPWVYSPAAGGLADLREVQADWDSEAEEDLAHMQARYDAGAAATRRLWLVLAFVLAVNLPAVAALGLFRLFS